MYNLEALKFQRFRFVLRCQAPMRLNDFIGNELRGAFGWVLRNYSCLQMQATNSPCSECQNHESCSYGFLFESRDQNGQAIARPYMMEPLFTQRTIYAPGEAFSFNLVLIGRALERFSECLKVIQELGQRGLGQDYKQGHGRFQVETVETCNMDGSQTLVYQGDESTQLPIVALNGAAIAAWATNFSSCHVGIHFISPMYLRESVRPRNTLKNIEFHHLWDSLQNRIEELMRHHAESSYLTKTEFKELKHLALSIRKDEDSLCWQSQWRPSRGQMIDMGGLTGYCAFTGNLTPLLPVLAVGEWLHTGHGCDLGNGRYSLAVK